MRPLLIKVCGMRDVQNITELIPIRPNFMGFIFHAASPRNVIEKPKVDIPTTIQKVGVFVNQPIEFVLGKVIEFDLDYVQLHGDETPAYCQQLKATDLGVIKVFKIKDAMNIEEMKPYTCCDFFLFDYQGQQDGGNGLKYDWSILQNYDLDVPFFLSGGIGEEDADQIKQLPFKQLAGVDLNSQFELEPAIKEIERIKAFKHALYEV